MITIWWLQKLRKAWEQEKQTAQKFDVEVFNLSNLCKLKVTKQYQIKTSNRFAALENLNDYEDIIGLVKTLQRILKPQQKAV